MTIRRETIHIIDTRLSECVVEHKVSRNQRHRQSKIEVCEIKRLTGLLDILEQDPFDRIFKQYDPKWKPWVKFKYIHIMRGGSLSMREILNELYIHEPSLKANDTANVKQVATYLKANLDNGNLSRDASTNTSEAWQYRLTSKTNSEHWLSDITALSSRNASERTLP